MLFFNTWGGGGWGDPYTREVEKIETDVRRGLVTKDGAKRYGVVLNEDLTVDMRATEALRAKLSAERGEPKMFDRGFDSIAELKARCKAETGLEPPADPGLPRAHPAPDPGGPRGGGPLRPAAPDGEGARLATRALVSVSPKGREV